MEATKTRAAVLPPELVGTWESLGGDATLTYRFITDGRYRFTGVITQPRPEGVYKLIWIESGTASVEGNVLVLHPTEATSTRRDPAHPKEDYTNQPGPLMPKRYIWRIDGTVLFLTDESGVQLSFNRQPSKT